MIELRSDTFTLPTQEMLAAMAAAPLGDDVWGEDPTVTALEEKAADLLGKEAALLVTSGTQGNLIGILSHTSRGDEVIVGDKSHIFNGEVAGAAVIGGVQLRTVSNTPRGTLDPSGLRAAIRRRDIHHPPTRLICLENSHNACGGAVLNREDMSEARGEAQEAGASLHLDGARIFNSAVALGVDPAELAKHSDSVTFCLSKGLSAPVGSILCGPAAYIERARKYRKMLGGGMRQAGIIAAPGIVALDTMINRLAEDHANARRLGEALSAMPGVHVDLDNLRTNIVLAGFEETGMPVGLVVEALLNREIRAAPVARHRIRFVTHRGVSREDVDAAVLALGEIFQPLGEPIPA